MGVFLKFSQNPDVLRKLITKKASRMKFVACAAEVKQFLQAKERRAQQKLADFTVEDFDLMSLADWLIFECNTSELRERLAQASLTPILPAPSVVPGSPMELGSSCRRNSGELYDFCGSSTPCC